MRLLPLLVVLALSACGAAPPPASERAAETLPDGGAECPPPTHPCPCATGFYCLGMGQMCRVPHADCPSSP